ncbi:hypothetical protein BBK36DRAFT_1160580 [Trichoderma citrinoviride]|uniref:Uncharacterized protein n=1 Tax=Trichoderma citrinoviride TaxID=58853 RepID=A0A2T4B835_9HYPO|nr:hypothetical protein BBK36DRAFT_1160580 [Trichoderma citrinoviride]PTB65381.1 hypothetical protein BBK36DRAFT_1160580 [Trichoderma citrinoviride]
MALRLRVRPDEEAVRQEFGDSRPGAREAALRRNPIGGLATAWEPVWGPRKHRHHRQRAIPSKQTSPGLDPGPEEPVDGRVRVEAWLDQRAKTQGNRAAGGNSECKGDDSDSPAIIR